jgi:hypothetical protein
MGFELWTLLNFSLWHRHWIEGDDLREMPSFAASAEALAPVGDEVAARSAASGD